ncbi:putative salt-induced outer membrane protein [Aurantiacibacter atlanticus]|uniref:Putative salt-induced outer membrane protein n=1 Tax=Aurantiacibacter atlanticus TaxID=1648404 RepID=A0A0H4VYW2_9SPHN|nr:DUF481 domain-containing protein [Aurantiacibacter atlanticus]AKQ42358.1 putative salt-induced outer membrane protein [Aurantiacibacter atlanticus]MDF1834531.1 DUF481 domain-containing protein [Alteraurantiacibacter sp. bin_em_oilr2.035]
MRKSWIFAAPLMACATPAAAELPEAARAMIEAAIANGDAEAVEAVLAAARTAFPADVAEIEMIEQAYAEEQALLATSQAAAEEEAIRSAGPFDNWSGEGQIGGFQSSGNSDEIGTTAALQLTREGIDWEHRLRLSVDYRRSDGVTSREQFLGRYEPRYQINDRLFTYGLVQFERDKLQGYSARYVASGGLGYRVIDTDAIDLSIKAGPAYRITHFIDGGKNSRLAGLLGLDFDWRLSDSLKLTQDANATAETGGEAVVIVDGSNTSLSVITGLEAGLSDSLTARVSYSVEYDSNPPDGSVSTDTLTRFTLIYGF